MLRVNILIHDIVTVIIFAELERIYHCGGINLSRMPNRLYPVLLRYYFMPNRYGIIPGKDG